MIYINGRFLEQDLTGVQRFAGELALELSKLRDDITVLVPNKSKIKNQQYLHLLNIVEVSGYTGHLWEQVTLVNFLVKNNKPALLNLCSTAPLFYKNQIVTHHDITYIRYPQSFSKKFRMLYKLLIPLMLKNSKKVITVSDFSKQEISEHYHVDKEKIEIINNAVNGEFIPMNNSHKERYALAVSSANYHKNFAMMIDAFLESNADMSLYIIGSMSSLSFSSVKYTEDPRIKFLGRVDDKELITIYQKASFFIFPSLYEGFGIPPLEAQACGCPVISSNVASMPEVLENSVIYFNPFNKSEIIAAIEKISADQLLSEQLIQKGLANVERFSWKKSAIELNNIIEKVFSS